MNVQNNEEDSIKKQAWKLVVRFILGILIGNAALYVLFRLIALIPD